uniref:Uncharacterized protein n=1 Tax=Candidatus Methanogaster sp. ANME-2c ERB4 TaxID=2759911 RepID=A0A7G9Y2S4_9EURY|nr:hypothetical protein CIDILJJO_00009 [Methanosarcinales archaeon ANME-2c ERB4]QNO42104.1 hypothetical protein INBEEEIC_00006 [Methanosarcinales archaeon ANME-2c ERB4]QNO42308.1 hypothetical protein OEDCDHIP_00025 [Methanosarcinales archaeon ANME-2c ERB4]QNO42470.1 hypothetical protein LBOOMNCC_00023 [Methanosarcinales archaeon ANME-2c ERB4]QNO42706.1 hypothetical protein AOABALHP_00009 [Methanosarcinales archaeon ANME-2c ERB4]
MMKAGDKVHLYDSSTGYADAVIESVSTHSKTGYEFTAPIARVEVDGEFIGSFREYDFELRDGELWEREDR